MSITGAQRTAMEIGSIFGFDVPGADPDFHLKDRTTMVRRRKTKMKTMTKKMARKAAEAMKTNAYYQYLRKRWGYGAGEAMAAVKRYRALTGAIEIVDKEEDRRDYPSGIARVVNGYWVFGS